MPVIINEVEVLEPATPSAGGPTGTPPVPAPMISADAVRRLLDDVRGREARRTAD